MSLRCRLGIHRWTRWETRREVTKHIVRSVIGHRMPNHDFTTARYAQVRYCHRCGLKQRIREE